MSLTFRLLITLFFISFVALFASAQSVSRVEPPHWWVGMENENLQIMVYGKGIGDYKAKIEYPGIEVKKQLKGDSPNYLFLYLELAVDLQPGILEIVLSKGKKKQTIDYELKPKSDGKGRNLGFSSKDLIYLLMPDRFANGDVTNDKIEGMLEAADRSNPNARHGGDIKGILDHLDYIKELGMTAVWLTPVFENDMTPDYGAYHGYAATDLYKIDRRFGSNEEFKNFVDACHAKGLKVIMDMIHNHIGDQHWWMKDLPTKDWVHDFAKYGQSNFRGPVVSDPYHSNYDLEKLQKGWFVKQMPDLNQHNEWLADYLIQNTLWWIEYSGIDGIRMDTYVYPYKDYMARWAKEVIEAYPTFNIVGEAWVETVAHESFWQEDNKSQNDGYNSYLPNVTDFQIHFAMKDAFTEPFGWDKGIRKLYYALSQDRLYSDPMKNVIFMDNHDLDRFYTVIGSNKEHFKMAYAYLLTTRGIPQIYYGTELMLAKAAGTHDAGKRPDMVGGWPDDTKSVFTEEGRSQVQNEIFSYTSKIANWRKKSKPIHEGKLMHFIPEDNTYLFFRYTEKETVMVVMNMNENARSIDPKRYIERLRGFSTAKDIVTNNNIDITSPFDVPAKTTSIFELK